MRRTEWLKDFAWALGSTRIWHHHRVLGRFRSWTRAQRWWRRSHRAAVPPPWALLSTLFSAIDAPAVADSLRAKGYYASFQLPAAIVEQLVDHARRAPCRRNDRDLERFRIGEVRNGLSPTGQPVAIADVEELERCPTIEHLAGDRTLVDIARLYLGYPPSEVLTRLYWSPRSTLSDSERRTNGQTIDFHYDIERRNALYVYFYLTEVDRESGAHVVIAQSHALKPLRMKLSSTRQAERRVVRRFGHANMVVIEGGPGFGFCEDPACFHKALPPLKDDRLILQFRYI